MADNGPVDRGGKEATFAALAADFKFDDKDPIKLNGAPAACKMQFQRPNDGTANAQRLNEQNFMNGDNSNYGAMFANKIVVDCP